MRQSIPRPLTAGATPTSLPASGTQTCSKHGQTRKILTLAIARNTTERERGGGGGSRIVGHIAHEPLTKPVKIKPQSRIPTGPQICSVGPFLSNGRTFVSEPSARSTTPSPSSRTVAKNGEKPAGGHDQSGWRQGREGNKGAKARKLASRYASAPQKPPKKTTKHK